MERAEAIERLKKLEGTNLRPLADSLRDVTVWKNGKLNKGWVGHTIERYLGLPLNSSRAPNFGSWELKVASLKHLKNGKLVVKETIAITMLDPVEVVAKDFQDSHLFNKLQKILVVARIDDDRSQSTSMLHGVYEFDVGDGPMYRRVKADYEKIRQAIKDAGFSSLTGAMGNLIQPRTKGAGHGTTSRAFYGRKAFVGHIVGPGAGYPLAD